MRVKFCGTTELEPALHAVAAGADALGFIFYPPSARNISPEKAREIIAQLPSELIKVGVFVNEGYEQLCATIDYCGLNAVQLHGSESVAYCQRLRNDFSSSLLIIKAFRVGPASSAEDFSAYAETVDAYLLDTYSAGAVGGTGKSFSWEIIPKLALQRPFILAGGISCENVVQAMKQTDPYALDINSGVESAPGVKDCGQISAIMKLISAV